MSGPGNKTVKNDLNHLSPAAYRAQLGQVIEDLINAHNDLRAQFVALLAHLDTANVAGIGNGNAAAYGPTVSAVTSIENR